jgi:hypothetical protein
LFGRWKINRKGDLKRRVKKRSFLFAKSVVVGKEWMTEVERVTDAMATKYGLGKRRKRNRAARGSQGLFV